MAGGYDLNYHRPEPPKRRKVIVLAVFERYIEAESLKDAQELACNRIREACGAMGIWPEVLVPVPDCEKDRVEDLAYAFYDLYGF